MAAGPRALDARLELDIAPDGTPANPVVEVDLDRWRDAPAELTREAAARIGRALPVTVGVLAGPPSEAMLPLLKSLTLTLAGAGARARALPAGSRRAIVPLADIPGTPDMDGALERLRAAVSRSPRAALACAHLLKNPGAAAGWAAAGLAAEAAAYSMLLGGPEFARWLAERGEPRRREPPAEPVVVSRDGGRLSITLNDPARRNAFSAAMREGLLDALEVASADDTVESVELRGAGPAFCSGGDLDEFGTAKDLVAAYLVRLSRAPWGVIDRIAARVTVYCHGACVGAGTEISAYADRVIATPDAFFALPEVGMGLVPGAGGSVSVPRRIGRQRAAWLMLTGDRLPATTALRWGLVDEIHPLGRAGGLQGLQAFEHLAQQAHVGDPAARRRRRDLDEVLVQQVAEHDADHAERQADRGGEFGDRGGHPAQLEDAAAFGA